MSEHVNLEQATRRLYRLDYHGNEHGVGKVVEFSCGGVSTALQLIREDASQRSVDLWEEGRLLCHVSHGLTGICVSERTSVSARTG